MTPEKEKAIQIFTLMAKHQQKTAKNLVGDETQRTAPSLIKLRTKSSSLEALFFIISELESYRDPDTVIYMDNVLTNRSERILFYQRVRKEVMKL